SSLPIADYGLVSDCHSAALVSRMGSVDWLCFPRFDAPSIFGRLLDDNAGHWSIHPTVECSTTQLSRHLQAKQCCLIPWRSGRTSADINSGLRLLMLCFVRCTARTERWTSSQSTRPVPNMDRSIRC